MVSAAFGPPDIIKDFAHLFDCTNVHIGRKIDKVMHEKDMKTYRPNLVGIQQCTIVDIQQNNSVKHNCTNPELVVLT